MDAALAIINVPAFLQTLDNDEELLQEILGYYIDDSGRIVKELTQAIAGGDSGATLRLAHTLKGSSANVHASRLRDAASQLEAAISQKALVDQSRLLETIVQCRNELVARLRSERPDLFCRPEPADLYAFP